MQAIQNVLYSYQMGRPPSAKTKILAAAGGIVEKQSHGSLASGGLGEVSGVSIGGVAYP